MSWHETFIPELAKVLQPKVYVELGLYEGETIGRVKRACPNTWTIGVDHIQRTIPPGVDFYKMTTVEFLERAKEMKLVIDLLFIDADHSFESSMRDFVEFSGLVPDQGVILLHDTYPKDQSFIHPGYCGTVYRTAEYLRFAAGFEITTIPVPPGLSIVRKCQSQLPWELI
jgi:predicted O-methyltransferase YrrM